MTAAFALGPALLFCPADRPDRYATALERADAVILDLEDAVEPSRRAEARKEVVRSRLDPDRVIVRVNPATSPDHSADVDALARSHYRYAMLAKAESRADLELLSPWPTIALCETAAGVLAAAEIASTPAVVALMWGAEDLVVSLGGTSSRTGDGAYRDVVRHARSAVALAAAAHGVGMIDTVHLDIDDADGLAAEAADAAALGFVATACIHPAQVGIIRDAYRPSVDEIERARELLAAAEGMTGAFRFRGTMVDAPVLRHAHTVVHRAGTPTIR
ncbi:HpcH/HpaI aldolase/citrate lyase family protein [Agromyces atrinae]|uniref:Citrate lyase subunit beta/citryl-CoA lyase n=1 Tax=Agromyces atrinae TaxID=592376 RepID=A0A4Q2M4M4_9MICO|nr:CoA ester lyase [Agromyces atrinae]NYD65836.1 citrate lyase subunit beta/citryl-CoA lyase [Agromyces atrinae]RXZ86187.1 CoA ester lyase [Agromyces atrinae]